MASRADLQQFQEILDRVARTRKKEEIDGGLVPDVRTWGVLDGKGCLISVKRGRWWVLPQR